MLKPLMNMTDEKWILMIGRYILNMGSVELTSRLLIAQIHGTDQTREYHQSLDNRLKYLRKRFPRADTSRHKSAMNTFKVALLHVSFRNIVAHGPIVIAKLSDGSFQTVGIANLAPRNKSSFAEVITLEELTGRVDESAVLGRKLAEMQLDYLPLS